MAKGTILSVYRLWALLQRAYSALPYYLGGGRALPPMHYALHLTLRCNLRCSYCFITGRSNSPELTTDDWLKVIGQIHPFSIITVSGGEVTTMKDFAKILHACRMRGKVHLITNGTLLTDELIRLLLDEGVFMVGVSLDGMRDRHDKLRGVKGTFDRVLANLERFKALRGDRKRPMLDIKPVITGENLEDLPDLYRLCGQLGADFFSPSFLKGCDLQFSPAVRTEFGPEYWQAEYPIAPGFNMERFREVYSRLMEMARNSSVQIRMNPEFTPRRGMAELQLIEEYFASGSRKVTELYKPCRVPWVDMCILSNGDVIPCLSLKVGNVKDQPLSAVWNGEAFRGFRRRLRRQGVFNACQACCYCKVRKDL